MTPKQIDNVARDTIKAIKNPGEREDVILRLVAEIDDVYNRIVELRSEEPELFK